VSRQNKDLRARQQEFSELLAPLRERLYRFAVNRMRDRSRAEDALQDAVLSAYRRYDSFEPGTDFRAWMYRFVLNTVLNYNRSNRRDRSVGVEPPMLDLHENLRTTEAYEEVLADPERFLQQVGDGVREAVLELRDVEQTVFLLRAVEGFTYREIAESLQMPIGTVMSHLARSRAKMRERLAGYAEASGFLRRSTA
jgi:RNA polymerase sigma-70 factor (ECF subfamily)